MKKEHIDQINRAIEEVKKRDIKSIYFVACGGSQAVLMPGKYMMDRNTDLISQVYTANEFVYDAPKSLGKNSIVISISHSGTTPETVNATKLGREKGAITISFSHADESPLWQATEFPIHYDWGTDADASDLNKPVVYGLVFKLLEHFTGDKKWAVCFDELNKLQDLTVKVKKDHAESAEKWGQSYKRSANIYTIGSGINYGEVYSTAMCWFMEMQWINSAAINSGEYFHGPFEVTDYDVPFILVKSIGNTRHLDERVEKFAKQHTKCLEVLDQADLPLDDVKPEAKEFIAAILSGVVIRQMVEAIAYERGHSLDVRRYMWHLDY
ncbi:SIS domain-containing protein [Lactobacillus sp. ESL0731]|uniref:SIS domain-containing protein n=1 Tax=unclassified Lactobacillus TaxID=2620435 RepID=UPI0023F7C1E3|nr:MULTISPECIES: SIS domain-containing protein [unclassified Lactobacillus]WEV51462.1 SIS domain-containing protein [Lactobacillus sp. ESL0700]WEV62591.1 SIS domain-containing protein [Lactobacillus sp. ESL0731]